LGEVLTHAADSFPDSSDRAQEVQFTPVAAPEALTPPAATEPVAPAPSFNPAAAGPEAVDVHGHLRVDELQENLRHTSARSAALMIGSHAIQLLLGVTGTAVLARLLRPQDFGYLAMVATLTHFVATFRDLGLPMAAVQKRQLSHEHASGLFWLNVLASVAVAALVAGAAPLLAWFYSEPRLVAITLVMSLGILAHSLGTLHVGLLRRRMRFGAVTVLEISAVFAGLITGVAAARLGAGYWALVVQQIAIYVTQSIGAWVMCAWRPAPRHASASLRDPELRAMVQFGTSASAARIVSYLGRNLDSILVGYFAGPGVLGLYQKASQWAAMPFWQVYNPLLPVAVSSFSRLQDDPDRYRLYVRTTLLGLFSLTLPATALMFLTAEPIVLLLLGRQWVEAIPLFRIFAMGAYFASFGLVTRSLYLAEGRTPQQLRWALVAAPVTAGAVAAGLPWGASGIAWGFSVATALLALPAIAYCLRGSPLTWRDIIAGVWRPMIASLLAAGIAFLVTRLWIGEMPGRAARLALDAVVYGALYLACWLALPRGAARARDVLSYLRPLLPS
jgi:PST family polysaccharide transporter